MGPLTSAVRHGARLRGLALLLPSLAALGACATDPGRNPSTFAITNTTASSIRMDVCRPGTFIGTMTINCPEVVR